MSDDRPAGLAGPAARAIYGRMVTALGGEITPEGLLAVSTEDLRTAGLSGNKGIGRWSAEMFLLFQLRRLDVWPTGDLVVRKGFALAWDIPTPTPKQLDALGEPYHPYRSVVAWYCWRAAQLYAGAKASAVTS